MRRWEYLRGTANAIRRGEEPVQEALDRLGYAGWELVSVVVDHDVEVFYLKREVPTADRRA